MLKDSIGAKIFVAGIWAAVIIAGLALFNIIDVYIEINPDSEISREATTHDLLLPFFIFLVIALIATAAVVRMHIKSRHVRKHSETSENSFHVNVKKG